MTKEHTMSAATTTTTHAGLEPNLDVVPDGFDGESEDDDPEEDDR
jgi:hypothetical protein